jgi:hypothetical protein
MNRLILAIRNSHKPILLVVIASTLLLLVASVGVYAHFASSGHKTSTDKTTNSSNNVKKSNSTAKKGASTKTDTTTTNKSSTTKSTAPSSTGGTVPATPTTTTPTTPTQSTPALTTPATGGFQSNCIVTPHLCGYPDATNTGVPAGTTLTNSGSLTVTQDGAVIQNLNITGNITIHANNVTIRNTRITSGDYYPIAYYDTGHSGLLVEDTQIIGTSSDVTAGISFDNYTARRVDISGTADGLKANDNVLIEDSYVHDLAYDAAAGTHNDGVQTTGGSNVTLRHNTFKLSMSDGINSCIQMGNEGGDNLNWLVTNNLFDGGGWEINASPAGTNRTFTNNRFTHNSAYGVGYVGNSTWTGNYYDNDGATVDG